MNQAIVTGADGFIGKALVSALIEGGVSATAIVQNEKFKENFEKSNKLQILTADFSKYEHLAGHIPYNADVFYHLAWAGVSGSGYNSYQTQIENIMATCDALNAAISSGCKRFVFIGSSHEYLYEKDSLGNNLAKRTLYGAAKTSARAMCEAIDDSSHKIQICTAFFTNVFGVGDLSSRSTNVLVEKFILGETPCLIKGENKHDWIYIDDAVSGLIAIGEHGKDRKQYYIGNRSLKKFCDIITSVRDILAPKMPLSFGGYDDNTFIDYSLIDLDAAYCDLGFIAKCDFVESILKTAKWVEGKRKRDMENICKLTNNVNGGGGISY